MGKITRRDAGKILVTGCASLLVNSGEAWAGVPARAQETAPAAQGKPENSHPRRRDHEPAATSAPRQVESDEPEWSDVFMVEQPERVISYRTGWVVYEESLSKGQFVGRGWNGAGYINFYDGRIDPAEHFMPEAFRLEIDGQSLTTDWNWGGLEKTSSSKQEMHVVVTLQHAVRPVTVKVHTKLDGTAILTRWLEITNTGSKPAAIAQAYPWSGVLRQNDRWRSHLNDTGLPLYSLGYFDGDRWGEEGNFHWHDLPNAEYSINGKSKRERWRHPLFILRNNATGEFFIGQLAWSGGYDFSFDLDTQITLEHGPNGGALDTTAALTFGGGPTALAPQRVLAAGETVLTPEMHLGLVYGGLDSAVQAMHTHIRRSVILPQVRHKGGWIESGIGPEVEITPVQLNNAIDEAIAIGAEVFFIDASWYAPPNGNWWKLVGNWRPNLERFPQGLDPFRERAHAGGMLWGLWMDSERVGDTSDVAKEHPDWLAMNYDSERKMGGQLDLTNPAAAQWMESEIVRIIQEYKLDFFRLDYNTGHGRGIKTSHEGYIENGYWRYYQTQYAIWDRVRARFPNVVFENCAGGGSRTDLGIARAFDHTDQTDWQIAPRSFLITNGMTMALPPEYTDRLIGGQSGQTAADFDFQARLLLFVQPKFGFLWPIGATPNPVFVRRTKHWVDLYKNFVRPFIATSRIYHHTPEVSGLDPHGWGVLELISEDRTRGICGLFQLSAPTEPEYLLRLRGLDLSRKYRVTFDNSGSAAVMDGLTLMNGGLTVRLEGALTSQLLLFEEVG